MALATTTKRVFFAIRPSQSVRMQLEKFIKETTVFNRLKKTFIDDLHLTLHFLHCVTPDDITNLCNRINTIQAISFECQLERLELWPEPNIICATPKAPIEPLTRLHQAIKVELQASDLAVEQRSYKPHVTLARKATILPPNIQIPKFVWQVEQFYLYESLKNTSAPHYRIIHEWSLRCEAQ